MRNFYLAVCLGLFLWVTCDNYIWNSTYLVKANPGNEAKLENFTRSVNNVSYVPVGDISYTAGVWPAGQCSGPICAPEDRPLYLIGRPMLFQRNNARPWLPESHTCTLHYSVNCTSGSDRCGTLTALRAISVGTTSSGSITSFFNLPPSRQEEILQGGKEFTTYYYFSKEMFFFWKDIASWEAIVIFLNPVEYSLIDTMEIHCHYPNDWQKIAFCVGGFICVVGVAACLIAFGTRRCLKRYQLDVNRNRHIWYLNWIAFVHIVVTILAAYPRGILENFYFNLSCLAIKHTSFCMFIILLYGPPQLSDKPRTRSRWRTLQAMTCCASSASKDLERVRKKFEKVKIQLEKHSKQNDEQNDATLHEKLEKLSTHLEELVGLMGHATKEGDAVIEHSKDLSNRALVAKHKENRDKAYAKLDLNAMEVTDEFDVLAKEFCLPPDTCCQRFFSTVLCTNNPSLHELGEQVEVAVLKAYEEASGFAGVTIKDTWLIYLHSKMYGPCADEASMFTSRSNIVTKGRWVFAAVYLSLIFYHWAVIPVHKLWEDPSYAARVDWQTSTHQRASLYLYGLNIILLAVIAFQFSTDEHKMLSQSNVDYAFWREDILFAQVTAWIRKWLIFTWTIITLMLAFRPDLAGTHYVVPFLSVSKWVKPQMLAEQQLSSYVLAIIATSLFGLTHRIGDYEEDPQENEEITRRLRAVRGLCQVKYSSYSRHFPNSQRERDIAERHIAKEDIAEDIAKEDLQRVSTAKSYLECIHVAKPRPVQAKLLPIGYKIRDLKLEDVGAFNGFLKEIKETAFCPDLVRQLANMSSAVYQEGLFDLLDPHCNVRAERIPANKESAKHLAKCAAEQGRLTKVTGLQKVPEPFEDSDLKEVQQFMENPGVRQTKYFVPADRESAKRLAEHVAKQGRLTKVTGLQEVPEPFTDDDLKAVQWFMENPDVRQTKYFRGLDEKSFRRVYSQKVTIPFLIKNEVQKSAAAIFELEPSNAPVHGTQKQDEEQVHRFVVSFRGTVKAYTQNINTDLKVNRVFFLKP